MSDERSEELKTRQENAVKVIQAQATTIGATVNPKIAREARDKAMEAVGDRG